MPIGKIEALRNRRDFQAAPLAAIRKRVMWRIHPRFRKRVFPLRLSNGDRIFATRSGVAALIYYQQSSEPETVGWLAAVLTTGDGFIDVGAHLGEHALVASKCVGHSGNVIAVEPIPQLARLIEDSARFNHRPNLSVINGALSDEVGTQFLNISAELSLSHLAVNQSSPIANVVAVRTWTLDSISKENPELFPRVVKIDAEGAEPLIVAGGMALWQRRAALAPIVVLEYSEQNSARLGLQASESLAILKDCGYEVAKRGSSVLRGFDPSIENNLVACKTQ